MVTAMQREWLWPAEWKLRGIQNLFLMLWKWKQKAKNKTRSEKHHGFTYVFFLPQCPTHMYVYRRLSTLYDQKYVNTGPSKMCTLPDLFIPLLCHFPLSQGVQAEPVWVWVFIQRAHHTRFNPLDQLIGAWNRLRCGFYLVEKNPHQPFFS